MTATTTPTAAWADLETALHQRRPVHVTYHGHHRLLCPHALGWTNHGRPIVLAYQTGGHTTAGALDPDPHHRWRCLRIDDIERIDPADPAEQWDTADNYDPAHPFPTTDHVATAIT